MVEVVEVVVLVVVVVGGTIFSVIELVHTPVEVMVICVAKLFT